MSFGTTLIIVSSIRLQAVGPKKRSSLQCWALLKYSRMPISFPMILKCNLKIIIISTSYFPFFTMCKYMLIFTILHFSEYMYLNNLNFLHKLPSSSQSNLWFFFQFLYIILILVLHSLLIVL